MKDNSLQIFLTIFLFSLIHLSFTNAQSNSWATYRPDNIDELSYINSCFKPFYHGVASGDPLPDKVIIWTRFTPEDSLTTNPLVIWEVATDLQFTNIIRLDSLNTDASKDFTVKVDVTGLNPNTYYYYRFSFNGQFSLIGRTKTTAITWVDRLRFGFVSCSDYRRGYFTAYRKLAERNDLDAVVHLGDYIYESGGGPNDRLHEPDAEIYRLQDYRARFSQYHLDPDLMRCHQVHPYVVIWDDHDIVVDALRDTSYRHNAAIHGSYTDRKHAAVQAMREWLPIRDDSTEFFKNWKHLPFGELVDLYTIDVRLYDRDRFATNLSDTIFGDPNHKLLGPVQMQWINNALANSNARWKLIANQLMVGHLGIFGTPLVFENWDGYPVERDQFFNNLINHNIQNVIFLTGDFHCSFSIDLSPNPYDTSIYNPVTGIGSIATEFVVPSITGDNFNEGNDFGLPSATAAVNTLKYANPNVKFAELEGHGYILMDIDSTRAQAEFWYMDNILDPANNGETIHEIYYTNHEDNHVTHGSIISIAKQGIPVAPAPDTCNTVSYSKIEDKPVILSIAPNPFKNFILLNYVLNKTSKVEWSIFQTDGKIIKHQYVGKKDAGNHNCFIKTSDINPGIYFLKINFGNKIKVFKIIKNE